MKKKNNKNNRIILIFVPGLVFGLSRNIFNPKVYCGALSRFTFSGA